jgi:hypothetical protein
VFKNKILPLSLPKNLFLTKPKLHMSSGVAMAVVVGNKGLVREQQ